MVNNKFFFDTHAHNHAYHKGPEFYRSVIGDLAKIGSPVRLLDLGCGDGSFIKSIVDHGISGDYLGIDISPSMLRFALEGLRERNVNLVVADGFNLPLRPEVKFDLIHLDSVLHHLIGKTRSRSRCMARSLLEVMLKSLADEGFMVIEEIYYSSYVISSMTSSVIFYGLKLINLFKLDLRRLIKPIIPGLQVNFYSENELVDILNTYGEVRVIKKKPSRVLRFQKLFLQKEYGHVSFILKNLSRINSHSNVDSLEGDN